MLSFNVYNLLFCSIEASIVNLILSWDSSSKIGFNFVLSIALIHKLFSDTIELFLNLLCIMLFL